MIRAHRIYVYGKQKAAALSLLDQCGMAAERWRVQAIETGDHLRGLAYGTFLTVVGHPAVIPGEIIREVELCGLVVFQLDDGFARARAAQRCNSGVTDAAPFTHSVAAG